MQMRCLYLSCMYCTYLSWFIGEFPVLPEGTPAPIGTTFGGWTSFHYTWLGSGIIRQHLQDIFLTWKVSQALLSDKGSFYSHSSSWLL